MSAAYSFTGTTLYGAVQLSDGTPVVLYEASSGVYAVGFSPDRASWTVALSALPSGFTPEAGGLAVDASDNLYISGSSGGTYALFALVKGSGHAWTTGTVLNPLSWAGGQLFWVADSTSPSGAGWLIGIPGSGGTTTAAVVQAAQVLANTTPSVQSTTAGYMGAGVSVQAGFGGNVIAGYGPGNSDSQGAQTVTVTAGTGAPVAGTGYYNSSWYDADAVSAWVGTNRWCYIVYGAGSGSGYNGDTQVFTGSGLSTNQAALFTVDPSYPVGVAADPKTAGAGHWYYLDSSNVLHRVPFTATTTAVTPGTAVTENSSFAATGSTLTMGARFGSAFIDYFSVSGSSIIAGYTLFATAPSAPTIILPANNSYLDTSSGLGVTAGYNSTDDAAQNAYAARIKTSTASSYSYYNQTTNSLQSTIVWNADTVAVGGSWSYTYPAGSVPDGYTYNLSAASQESADNLQGAFASDVTVNAQLAPTMSVTYPLGSVSDANPSLTYTATPGSGSSITGGRWLVYPNTVVDGSGFTIDIATGTIPSGAVSDVSWTGNPLVVALQTGVNLTQQGYTAYAAVTETGSLWSATISSAFTVTYDEPAQPTVAAAGGTDPTTSCPLIGVTVYGHLNIPTAADASFEGALGSWGAGTDATLTLSSAYALDGADSGLAQFLTGTQQRIFESNTGNTVVGGGSYVVMAAWRAVSASRDMMAELETFNSSGTNLGVAFSGATVTDNDTGWTYSIGLGTVPSTATTARIQAGVENNDANGQLPAPAAPTVTVEGTAGTTTHAYTATVSNVYGSTPASPATTITTSNATLSGSDYNLVGLTAVPLPAGSSGNLVYDSDLTNAIAAVGPTWAPVGASIGTADGDLNALNGGTDSASVVFYGTGASANAHLGSVLIDVVGGATYTLAGVIDAANCTSGLVRLMVYDPTGATEYGEVDQTVGANGLVSANITMPSGATQASVYCDVANCVVTAGLTVSWSQIQLTETSSVQTYEPGPLPSYGIYRDNQLIGTTTALAFEDTGQAGGAAAPTTNTTGESHYIDCVALVPGDTKGYQLEVLSDGPVVYFPLTDAAGATSAVNAVGSGVGTVNGGVTFGQSGVVASDPSQTGALFDGSTGYIETTLSPSGSAVTVEGWYRTTQTTGVQTIWDSGALNDGTNVGVAITSGGILTGYLSGDLNDTSASNDGNWHQFALIQTGTSAVLYRDGAQVDARTVNAFTNGPYPGRIGSYGAPGTVADLFSGNLTHIAVFPVALSATRIAAHYQAALNTTGQIVQKWTAGGFAGNGTVTVTRSDGLIVRGANGVALPSPSQTFTVDDYEIVSGTSYTYSATISVTEGSAQLVSPEGISSSVVVTNTKWWVLDPTNPPSACSPQATQWNPVQIQQTTAHLVLGQPVTNIVGSVTMNPDFNATFELFDNATYDAFETLISLGKPLFISNSATPKDSGYYLVGPISGGLSMGMGVKAKDSQLLPSTAAAPHRTVQVTAVAAPRPTI